MSEIVMAVAEGIETSWALPVAEKLGFSIKVGSLETVDQFVETTTGCQAVFVALHKLDAEKIAKMPKSVKYCTAAYSRLINQLRKASGFLLQKLLKLFLSKILH